MSDNNELGITPIQASALRKGQFAMLKGFPCKIIDMSTSKTGKHGHAKVHFVGTDIFTGKKYEDICPSTHNMDQPNVSKTEYTLIDISDDYLSLMNEGGEVRDDIKLPDGELGAELQAGFDEGKELQVTIQSAVGQEVAIACHASRT